MPNQGVARIRGNAKMAMFTNPVHGMMPNLFLPWVAEVFAHWREPRKVVCPETGITATIQVDAGRAAAMAAVGLPGLKIIRQLTSARCADGD